MEKLELSNILSRFLLPIGFKKKGNYWSIQNEEISKIVNLQKSYFGKYFYLNYGYVLNSIPIEGTMMHIYSRVTSIDKNEQLRIEALLDLDNNISDIDRIKERKEVLQKNLINQINMINTEYDILLELKSLPHLNAIPINVKRYFNL